MCQDTEVVTVPVYVPASASLGRVTVNVGDHEAVLLPRAAVPATTDLAVSSPEASAGVAVTVPVGVTVPGA